MSRRQTAWQFLVSATLLLACNQDTTDKVEGASCTKDTKCPAGYDCTNDLSNPKSVGECKYRECGLTDLCKKPQTQCALKTETAMCDKKNNDKYCECIRPYAEDVPATPTTTGAPSTGTP